MEERCHPVDTTPSTTSAEQRQAEATSAMDTVTEAETRSDEPMKSATAHATSLTAAATAAASASTMANDVAPANNDAATGLPDLSDETKSQQWKSWP